MSLFQQGRFVLHSKKDSIFKIDCDALSDSDLDALAAIIVPVLPTFSKTVPIPTGGNRFAAALDKYATPAGHPCTIIVDDVYTSGASIQDAAASLDVSNGGCWPPHAVVIFARGTVPSWVTAIFKGDPEIMEAPVPLQDDREWTKMGDVIVDYRCPLMHMTHQLIPETLVPPGFIICDCNRLSTKFERRASVLATRA